jgi:hypothetical protein
MDTNKINIKEFEVFANFLPKRTEQGPEETNGKRGVSGEKTVRKTVNNGERKEIEMEEKVAIITKKYSSDSWIDERGKTLDKILNLPAVPCRNGSILADQWTYLRDEAERFEEFRVELVRLIEEKSCSIRVPRENDYASPLGWEELSIWSEDTKSSRDWREHFDFFYREAELIKEDIELLETYIRHTDKGY